MLRKLEEEEMAFICRSADNYSVLAADHAIENAKTFPEVICNLLVMLLLLSAQGATRCLLLHTAFAVQSEAALSVKGPMPHCQASLCSRGQFAGRHHIINSP
jgi:hypothetical protein